MYTVLVIDDEQMIVSLLQLALTKFGYNVEIATDGREGIQKFDKKFIDIVVTDICLPDIDGREVARHVRNSSRNTTPVVAISGTPWMIEDGYFNKILTKPFPIKALFDIIENLISSSQELIENRFLQFEPKQALPSTAQ